jgi:hypothetical protein
MKRFSRIACLALFAVLIGDAAGAWAQSPAFVSIDEDLPLMTGLSEEADAAMTFDSASGRIAETVASGPASAAEVDAFYHQTLPQLGWENIGGAEYRRGDEALTVEVAPTEGGGAEVRFRLRPSGS